MASGTIPSCRTLKSMRLVLDEPLGGGPRLFREDRRWSIGPKALAGGRSDLGPRGFLAEVFLAPAIPPVWGERGRSGRICGACSEYGWCRRIPACARGLTRWIRVRCGRPSSGCWAHCSAARRWRITRTGRATPNAHCRLRHHGRQDRRRTMKPDMRLTEDTHTYDLAAP